MDRVRKIVEIGLSHRAEAGIKVRQPLLSLKYKSKQLSTELESIVADEVNVRSIWHDDKISGDVELDTEMSEELLAEGTAREFIRVVQSLRKKAGFNISDKIDIFYLASDAKFLSAINKNSQYILKETLAQSLNNEENQALEISEESKIDNQNIQIGVRKIGG